MTFTTMLMKMFRWNVLNFYCLFFISLVTRNCSLCGESYHVYSPKLSRHFASISLGFSKKYKNYILQARLPMLQKTKNRKKNLCPLAWLLLEITGNGNLNNTVMISNDFTLFFFLSPVPSPCLSFQENGGGAWKQHN